MNKQALIIGGGSKFGSDVVNLLLELGWTVNLISGSPINQTKNLNIIQINWKTLAIPDLEKFLKKLPQQDLVFFNQNSAALNKKSYNYDSYKTLDLWKQTKDWSQSYFVSCILPFYIIHSLGNNCNKNTKVGWVLSALITKHEESELHYADYIGNKTQNFILMKNFSRNHKACFFGFNPDVLSNTNNNKNLYSLIKFLESAEHTELNGSVIKFDTKEDQKFKIFENE